MFSRQLGKFNSHSFGVIKHSEGKLLPQQKEALSRLQIWFQKRPGDIALVSMPTGSGKTGVMSCLPYFLGSMGLICGDENGPTGQPVHSFDKPILVIAPDLAITKQLEGQLSVSASGSCEETFLIRRGIVTSEQQIRHHVLPATKKIESTTDLTNATALSTFDMIIANAQKFLDDDWESNLDSDTFRLVIVDEAHHHPAKTWRRIVEKFRNHALVVFFTATPYRADRKSVLGDGTPIAYHLKLQEAIKAGIIRQPEFHEYLEKDFLEGINIRDAEPYTRQKIIDLQRTVLILKKVKERLEEKNRDEHSRLPDGVPHMAIVMAPKKEHADRLLDLWAAIAPEESPAETYHSDKSEDEKKRIMLKIRNNELSVVIIVEMLLEGFDHPPISIAAITHKIQSPVKFVQFVGRAQRIYRGSEGVERNGIAHIITHADYGQAPYFEAFMNEVLIPDTEN